MQMNTTYLHRGVEILLAEESDKHAQIRSTAQEPTPKLSDNSISATSSCMKIQKKNKFPTFLNHHHHHHPQQQQMPSHVHCHPFSKWINCHKIAVINWNGLKAEDWVSSTSITSDVAIGAGSWLLIKMPFLCEDSVVDVSCKNVWHIIICAQKAAINFTAVHLNCVHGNSHCCRWRCCPLNSHLSTPDTDSSCHAIPFVRALVDGKKVSDSHCASFPWFFHHRFTLFLKLGFSACVNFFHEDEILLTAPCTNKIQ